MCYSHPIASNYGPEMCLSICATLPVAYVSHDFHPSSSEMQNTIIFTQSHGNASPSANCTVLLQSQVLVHIGKLPVIILRVICD